MKAQMRAALVGALAIAIAALGPGSAALAATSAAPGFTSITFDVSPVNEGQLVTANGTFSFPADVFPYVTVDWGTGQTSETVGLAMNDRSFTFSHTYRDDAPSGTPQDTYVVTFTLEDGDGLVSIVQTANLVVRNVAPTVTMTASPATLMVSDSVTVSGSFTDPGVLDTFNLVLDWGDHSPTWTKTYTASAAKTFTATHPYASAGSYTVTATVTDDDTGVGVAQATLLVQAPNHPPTDLVLTPSGAFENGSATLDGSFADLDKSDAHTVALTWSDGSASESLALAAGTTTFSTSHLFTDPGSFTANVTVTDSPGATISGTATFAVANVAPTVGLGLSASSLVEGDSVTANVTVADPGVHDTFTLTLDFGDGSAQLVQPVSAGSFSTSHAYPSAGSRTLTASVTDRSGGVGTATAPLLVQPRNRAPSDLVISANAIVEGGTATLGGAFADLDAGDTHTVTVSWHDGTLDTTLTLGAGVTAFSATHVFNAAGSYTLGATVTDAAGASVAATTTVTVGAKSSGELVDGLVALLKSMDLEQGTQTSLLAKVDNACGALRTLGNEISAQNGKKLSVEQTQLLSAEMAKISVALSCPAGTFSVTKASIPTAAPRMSSRH